MPPADASAGYVASRLLQHTAVISIISPCRAYDILRADAMSMLAMRFPLYVALLIAPTCRLMLSPLIISPPYSACFAYAPVTLPRFD